MGDLFDLDNDGKLDAFEGAMKWDMIDHMTSGGSSSEEPKPAPPPHYPSNALWWRGFLKWTAIVIGGWAILLILVNFPVSTSDS